MGISLLGASTGLSASDLITEPKWTLIAYMTDSGPQNTLVWGGLLQNYNKLRIIIPYAEFSTGPSRLYIRPNQNSTNIYQGSGWTVESTAQNQTNSYGSTNCQVNAYTTGSTITATEIYIDNYSSNTEYKLIKTYCIYSNRKEERSVLFGSTSPITSLEIGSVHAYTVNYNPLTYPGHGVFIYGAK